VKAVNKGRLLFVWVNVAICVGKAMGQTPAAEAIRLVGPHALCVDENFVDPIGFHQASPVFSWKLPAGGDVRSQSAYQIEVTRRSDAEADSAALWDSGKVDSDQSVWVPYAGPPFESRQQVRWRVKYWDDQGRESEWSDDASIEMGLLSNEDWQADWVEVTRDPPTKDKVTIVSAEFGNRDDGAAKVADVAERLKRALANGATTIRAKPARLGGDPAPGMAKTLWVEYEVNGVEKKATIPENGLFKPYPSLKPHPGYFFRRDFTAGPELVQARLYTSALGICDFRINGKRVGNDVLSPGYTMYAKRVETLTYDVTPLVRAGDNAIGALLGEGWYAGNLLTRKRAELLGMTPKLIGQLELTYADGRVETITTDPSWKGTSAGPIRAGGLYHGEDYDSALELGSWDAAGYDDSAWAEVKTTQVAATPLLVPKRLAPVRVMKQVPAVKLTEPEAGRYVFDFGQNLVGVPHLKLPVVAGEKVAIRFAEILKKDGTLYTKNYRSARSQASYLANATGEVAWQPSLSFFGFRYVEISGLSQGEELTTASVTANVLHTGFKSTGTLHSSHAKLNQLQSNIRWGQLSNFIDIPTDCPQRDERLGWTGDAQVFLPTSFFNYDVHAFWARWLQSVRDEQTADGKIPHTVPSTSFGYASPGWADVIVTAPWEVYERTGDVRILADNYEAMKKWVGVYQRESEGLIPQLKGFGDWLQPHRKGDNKGDTAQDLIATAYFGRDARILHWTAAALGKSEDAEQYKQLHADIRAAFTRRYFSDADVAEGANTQTACLMGLAYDLIEPQQREMVEERLMERFAAADRHLRTGFLGTPLLAPVFDEMGNPEICFELLFKESYPSWFYSINQGATTMWERWNSYSHADGFGDDNMNSFNHYAYGAIGQFIYERIAGLTPDPQQPGYKHFFVRPLVGGPLESISAELETPYGMAKSGWRRSDEGLWVEAIVPPNTLATAILPTDRVTNVLVNGQPVTEKTAKLTDGSVTIQLEPGTHLFQVVEANEPPPQTQP
jgi:alpha-L-rhamnosidase